MACFFLRARATENFVRAALDGQSYVLRLARFRDETYRRFLTVGFTVHRHINDKNRRFVA